jgi:hypothetical protein
VAKHLQLAFSTESWVNLNEGIPIVWGGLPPRPFLAEFSVYHFWNFAFLSHTALACVITVGLLHFFGYLVLLSVQKARQRFLCVNNPE